MAITYHLDDVKERVIKLIEENEEDFCKDMIKEISVHAARNGRTAIDDVEMFVDMIRSTEGRSEKQIQIVKNATCLSEILNIANDDSPGNVMFEAEDRILSTALGIPISQEWQPRAK